MLITRSHDFNQHQCCCVLIIYVLAWQLNQHLAHRRTLRVFVLLCSHWDATAAQRHYTNMNGFVRFESNKHLRPCLPGESFEELGHALAWSTCFSPRDEREKALWGLFVLTLSTEAGISFWRGECLLTQRVCHLFYTLIITANIFFKCYRNESRPSLKTFRPCIDYSCWQGGKQDARLIFNILRGF